MGGSARERGIMSICSPVIFIACWTERTLENLYGDVEGILRS